MNHHRIIITSNYSIEDIFGPDSTDSAKTIMAKKELVSAIQRRFKVHYVTDKDTPILVNEPEEEVKSPVHKR